MTYEEFVEYLKTNILTIFGEDKYRAIEREKTENGVTSVEVIWFDNGTSLGPTIYPLEFYKRYQNGESLGEVCFAISKLLEDSDNSTDYNETFKKMSEFEQTKELLKVIPLNFKSSITNLEGFVYKSIKNDIALLVYIDMGNLSSLKIRKEIVEAWDVTEEEVFDFAIKNMEKLYPPVVIPMFRALDLGPEFPMMVKDENSLFMDKSFKYFEKDLLGAYIISIKGNQHGALAAFYSGTLEKLSNYLKKDFYLILTISRECVIYTSGSMFGEDLRNRMQTEADVLYEEKGLEILSNKVYFYDSRLKKLMFAK